MSTQNEGSLPFITEEPMQGPALDCSWNRFKNPQLRACVEPPTQLAEVLGCGVDGVTFKASMGEKTCAVKVFWQIDEPTDGRYWAFRRECLNSALLDMIQTVVNAEEKPLQMVSYPKVKAHGIWNLGAFSVERRVHGKPQEYPGFTTISTLPRFRQCFGWTSVPGEVLVSLPFYIQEARKGGEKKKFDFPALEKTSKYYAIVYEYIPMDMEASPTEDEMQDAVDFLWKSGFCFALALKKDNWASGILLDMSDLICIWDPDWHHTSYRRHEVKDWLW